MREKEMNEKQITSLNSWRRAAEFILRNEFGRDPTAHASLAISGVWVTPFHLGQDVDSELHLPPSVAGLLIPIRAHCEQLLGGQSEFWLELNLGKWNLTNSYTLESSSKGAGSLTNK